MFSVWIAIALVFGFLARSIRFPPLFGFLVAGFLISAIGGRTSPLLNELADAGVLLLLFGVGLKLRLKTLLSRVVLGTGVFHLLIFSALTASLFRYGSGLSWLAAAVIGVSLGFSSTVLAAKGLEARRELRAVHGRIAIGILITQDLAAVAVLGWLSAERPSPNAFLLILLLPLLLPLLRRLLDSVDHGELLVLFGAVLAITIGGTGFDSVGLSPQLGALLLGITLSGHQRAQELSKAIWGLKEFLLVGFFLQIGMDGVPDWHAVTTAVWLCVLLLPFKTLLFFLLFIALGLRARTSFLSALGLSSFSEFGLIVIDAAVDAGLLGEDWRVIAAIAIALSFVLSAPLNDYVHSIYQALARSLERLERDTRHPDDEPISLGSAEMLIVGMGRLGSAAYDFLHQQRLSVVGADADPDKLERHRRQGRRVVYADAEDPVFWQQLNLDRLRAIMFAFPEIEGKRIAARELRRRGYRGLLSATHVYAEEREPILEAGCDVTYNYFTEAGVGFARDTWDSLRAGSNASQTAETADEDWGE